MIALVSGGTTSLREHAASGCFGRLIVPGDGNSPDDLPWACDNGAFSGFDERRFLAMLARVSPYPGCLWVTAPDVVGCAPATLLLFYHWEPRIRALGYPVALVAQDGLTEYATPWHRLDCLFVGGSTSFKTGAGARALMRAAKARGKLVHVGRVNGARRVRYLQGLGVVDSIDGSSLSKWSGTWMPHFANLLGYPQLNLLEEE